ncbi:hypothetical protein [Streptomyces fuscigenes]|uniref:hypothetical protein n=1 Tax=Streptomyces fuscigenes TaxID=1528880 RepID=UPI001F29B01D|nr:hypothetical protein [Streptomyces fuscigenes]MCF3962527.1 hypothetical protein [Streptomyces fuscigenes]
MEQRSDTNIKPVAVGAGVDPASVPGLVPLRAPEAEETRTGSSSSPEPGRAGEPAGRSGSPDGAAADPDGARTPKPGAASGADSEERTAAEDTAADRDGGDTPGSDAAEAHGAADADDADDADGPGDGPALDASDRRASITAGRRGVRFTLDDQEADFRWDEIGAVEVAVPRFGKRLGVVVHTHLGRSYEADAEAPSRAVLKEWSARLDAVLDAYFEDDGTGSDTADGPNGSPESDGPNGSDSSDDGSGSGGGSGTGSGAEGSKD